MMVIIRPYEPRDLEALLRMQETTWNGVVFDITQHTHVTGEYASPYTMVVAEEDGLFIGYGGRLKLENEPSITWHCSECLAVEDTWLSRKAYLTKQGVASVFFGEVYLPSTLTFHTKISLKPGPSDVYMTDMIVDPLYRQRGIGTQLVKARVERSIKEGAHALFVDCREGSASRKIYSSLGFIPVLSKKPHYLDGSGMTFMAYPVPGR